MKFSKYQGTGNDFIVIKDCKMHFFPNQIKDLCNRRFGIGGDGLIIVKQIPDADALIEIFNSDGSQAEMCGNGLRCIAQYLLDQGRKKKTWSIIANNKRYFAKVEGTDIIINMGIPRILEENTLDGISYYQIDSGVPHLIHFCHDLNQKDFIQIAKKLRYHNHFAPSGTNVNFVTLHASNHLQVRTYERGVEEETLSCGTGATAACVATWKKYGIRGRIKVEFFSKQYLQFDLLATDDLLSKIYMRGHARHVFEGDLKL